MHGQEEDDPHHPAGAHADAASRTPQVRAQQLRRGRLRLHASRRRWSRPSAACSAPTSRACAAARSASTSRASSRRSPRRTSTAPTTSSPTPTCCRRSAAASARRRTSARACAPSARRWSRWRSAGSSASSATWRSTKAGPTSPTSSRAASRSASSVSGPAGMACAADMAKAGCDVTVYEAFHEPGGVLKYGIPDFRLPNEVVDAEIGKLTQLGIKFECNTLVGRLFTIEQMIDRDGLPRRLHRHRRRLPELHGHSRRVAQRRALGQRAADPLQPDARARISRTSTRRCSPAGTSP